MTPRPPLTRAATELLAREDHEIQPPSADVDAAAIARIAEAIQSSARARKRRRWALAGGALAAAAAAAALLVGRPNPGARSVATPSPRALEARLSATEGAVSLARAGSTREVRAETLRVNDRLSTSDAAANLAISTGTQIVLEGNSDLTVVEQGTLEMYSLGRGSIRARVAKLSGAERFVVHTADADVEVRGTEFRVSIVAPDPSCGEGTTTRLDVTEGHVVVRTSRGEAHVLMGESWPRGCVPTTTAASPSTTAAAATTTTASAVRVETPPATVSVASAVAAPAAPASSSRASSDLAAQTAILAEATAARRRGSNSEAVAAYERLIARHPTSPLVETAYAERMRLLAKTDRGRAAAAAKDYLARFPRGYAHDEAATLAAPP